MENTNNYISTYQHSEIIQKIERLGGKYNPSSMLSIDDQLFICESLTKDEITPTFQERNKDNPKENVSVKWNDNDTYKRDAITTFTDTKRDIIEKLKTFTYTTPPVEIAQALQTLFADHPSKDGHWLYVAQHWNPRTINRVIERIIIFHTSGRKTIQNSAAYFTHLIKFRKKRRSL